MDLNLFFERMAEYNNTIWPTQIITYCIGIFLTISIICNWKSTSTYFGLILSSLWIWCGIVEFMIFFGSVSTQYYFWGSLWIIQAILFLLFSFKQNKIKILFDNNINGYLGISFIAYALIIYPLLGYIAGHGYPSGPIFGVAPCPVCIFTFGALLMIKIKIPYYLLIIPFIWGLLGIAAVLILGVYADAGEVVAAVLGTILILKRNKQANKNSLQFNMQASNPKGIIGFLIGMLMNFIHTKFYMNFINSFYLKKNAKILDIGCGGGKLVNKLSKCYSSSKIIGIDQSLEMVKLSKKVNRTEIEDRKVEIIKAALPVLLFENNHFDFITACETIQFWPELEKSIAEVKRVLSSKGVFMIINRFPSKKSKWYKLVQIKNDNQYCSLLKHAGFNKIDIKHKNGWIIIKAQ